MFGLYVTEQRINEKSSAQAVMLTLLYQLALLATQEKAFSTQMLSHPRDGARVCACRRNPTTNGYSKLSLDY